MKEGNSRLIIRKKLKSELLKFCDMKYWCRKKDFGAADSCLSVKLNIGMEAFGGRSFQMYIMSLVEKKRLVYFLF